jgi:hypothetical protein
MSVLSALLQRMPALCCAFLSSSSLALSIGAFTTCQFLKISYSAHSPEDGFLISDGSQIEEREEYLYDRHNLGIFCHSSLYSRRNDLMWNLSRYFLIAATVLLGFSFLLSWGIATIIRPTRRNWKALSVMSIATAGLQIPVFLFYAVRPCQTGETQCKAGQGFFMLVWSVMFLVSLTIVTQCCNYPASRESYVSWKIQERNYAIYRNEETFDEMDGVEMDGIESPLKREKHAVLNDPEFGDIQDLTKYPSQELNLNRRKRKSLKQKQDEDGNFYLLRDADVTSQCLSGMSAELPLGLDEKDFDLEDEYDLDEERALEEEDSKLIFTPKSGIEESEASEEPSATYNEHWGDAIRYGNQIEGSHSVNSDEELKAPSITHNEHWGEAIRNKKLMESADAALEEEETKLAPTSPPKKWSFKKEPANVGYIFLTEDEEEHVSHLVAGDDEGGVYNIDTIRMPRPRNETNNLVDIEAVESIASDPSVNENEDRDLEHREIVQDINKEFRDVVDQYKNRYDDSESSRSSEPMVHPNTVIVSTTDCDTIPVPDITEVRAVSEDDAYSDSSLDRSILRDKENIISPPVHQTNGFLSKLMSNFSTMKSNNIEYPLLKEDGKSETSDEWHDVLDRLSNFPIESEQSTDFENDNDLSLMRDKSRSGSNSNFRHDASHVLANLPLKSQITPYTNTPRSNEKDDHNIVSDDDDDELNDILDGPGRTLYPDEVEV